MAYADDFLAVSSNINDLVEQTHKIDKMGRHESKLQEMQCKWNAVQACQIRTARQYLEHKGNTDAR